MRRRGVVTTGTPRIGRGVVFDVSPGARVELEDGCVLGERCRIHARGGVIRIGAGAVLGDRCALIAHAGIDVGERAILADEVVVLDFDHVDADVERPVRLQGVAAEPVVIGAGARIGVAAAIERGARIRPGAVVGARAVVSAT